MVTTAPNHLRYLWHRSPDKVGTATIAKTGAATRIRAVTATITMIRMGTSINNSLGISQFHPVFPVSIFTSISLSLSHVSPVLRSKISNIRSSRVGAPPVSRVGIADWMALRKSSRPGWK